MTEGVVAELVASNPSREGMRPPRADYVDNLGRFTNALRRRSAVAGPRFFCTWTQLLRALGYEDRGDRAENMKLQRTVWNYMQALTEAGLVAYDGRAGTGGGLHVELTRPEALDSPASARSSAGLSNGRCQVRRRAEGREERLERRERPHRRRRQAPRRTDATWKPGPPSFFAPDKFGLPYGGRGGEAPKGTLSPPRPIEQLNAHAQAGLGIDERVAKLLRGRQLPQERPGCAGPPDSWLGGGESPADLQGRIVERMRRRDPEAVAGWATPAEEQERRAKLREAYTARRVRELESLASLLVDAQLMPALAPSRAWACFYALFGPSARISKRQRDRLERLLSRMDRAPWGKAGTEPGAGLEQLLYLMLDHYDDAERGEAARPASIAYFLPELSKVCRAWRRDAAARRPRTARGRRPRPGRGPGA